MPEVTEALLKRQIPSIDTVTVVEIKAMHNQAIYDSEAPGADPEDVDTWPIIGYASFYRAHMRVGAKTRALESPEGLTEENYAKLIDQIAKDLKSNDDCSLNPLSSLDLLFLENVTKLSAKEKYARNP